MNEPEPIESTTHEQATLLPWYLADTLDDQEKRDVETHLSTCQTCQMELDEMKQARTALQAAVSDREGPSPAVFSQVMARIREEKASTQQATTPTPQEPPSLWSSIEDWFQSIFAVPWVPVLATVLIVGQAGVLLTHLSDQSGSQRQGPIIERGIPQAPAPSKNTQIHVIFAEMATQGDIDSLLRRIHAQIIHGPGAQGAYTLEIPTQDPIQVQTILNTLLTQPAIINTATVISP